MFSLLWICRVDNRSSGSLLILRVMLLMEEVPWHSTKPSLRQNEYTSLVSERQRWESTWEVWTVSLSIGPGLIRTAFSSSMFYIYISSFSRHFNTKPHKLGWETSMQTVQMGGGTKRLQVWLSIRHGYGLLQYRLSNTITSSIQCNESIFSSPTDQWAAAASGGNYSRWGRSVWWPEGCERLSPTHVNQFSGNIGLLWHRPRRKQRYV